MRTIAWAPYSQARYPLALLLSNVLWAKRQSSFWVGKDCMAWASSFLPPFHSSFFLSFIGQMSLKLIMSGCWPPVGVTGKEKASLS